MEPIAEQGPEVVTGKVRRNALLTLLFLAGSLAEFLTGSTPIPRAVANPIFFLVLVGMYGGGALLIREVALRWGKGWGAVLLLGGAYAVGEEGFAAKTMIDPTGSNIGNQLYSHFAGINWVPLAGLTVFHAVFSITATLIIVELVFPEIKGRPLVGRKGVTAAFLAYALTVILVQPSDPYVISVPVGLFLLIYGGAFVFAAYRSPKGFLQAKGERPDRSERRFLFLGLGFMSGFFLIDFFVPLLLPWPATVVLFVPLVALTAKYLVNHAGKSGNDIVKVDFVLGMVMVFVPVDVGEEFFTGNVGVLFYTGLILLTLLMVRRRILGRGREIAPEVSGPPLPSPGPF
jgi:hypothetical protein